MNDFVTAISLLALSLIFVVVLLVVIAAIWQGRSVKVGPITIEAPRSRIAETAAPPDPGAVIYHNSDSAEFSDRFEKLFRQADRIVMIGTGFNILRREDLRKLLVERIQGKCHVEIYAANPFSPNVQTRLIEEETGDIEPNIRKAGLISWLGELISIQDRLPDKSKFTLSLFPFYPTYALFIFNGQDYFYRPYGYAQLSTFSPVTYYSAKNPAHKSMIQFLDWQQRQISQRSAPADLVYGLCKGGRQTPDVSRLAAFAVHLVPLATSKLYEWGSTILEYDVRRQRELQPRTWHKYIGAAFDFGLHITIADALYCPTQADISLICKELEFVAHEFRPFVLELRLEKDFPSERGIALVCQDRTGSLEALHHEMVRRVYSKAIASNYSLGLVRTDRDSDPERAKLMIEHYHAPYILQRFKPYFSLLSDVPADKKDRIYQELSDSFRKSGVEESIELRTIAVMDRPSGARHWQIRSENGTDCEYDL